MQKKPATTGLTLVEVMIAGAILTVVSLSLLSVMGNMASAIGTSREISLANHLAEEKMESLKSLSFYAVMVTSETPPVLDTNFSPGIPYDPSFYPPESIRYGGTEFSRKTFVEKAATPSGYVENVGYPHPDTGLKRVTVTVSWQRQTGEWKKVQLTSLTSNPEREALDKNMFGTVTDSVTGLPIGGVQVLNKRNPGQGAPTDDNGYYTFNTTDNQMKIIASKYGYEQYWTNSFNIVYGTNEWTFSMVPLSSAQVQGYVITYSSVVISGVNLQWDGVNNEAFIELYNCSTNAVDVSNYQYSYVDQNNVFYSLDVTTLAASIPATGYYLILGSVGEASMATPGVGTLANATFDTSTIPVSSVDFAGGIVVTDGGGTTVDSISWGNAGSTGPIAAVEGSYHEITPGPGIGAGNTLVRIAIATSTSLDVASGGDHYTHGNGWDSENNATDFVSIVGQTARNNTTQATPQGGRVLSDAYVTGQDEVSVTTITDSTGYYQMYMQVGSWEITGASGTLMGVETIDVALPGPINKNIWAVSPSSLGFITGTLIKYGADPLNNKIIQADPGGYIDISGPNGFFAFTVPADEYYYLTANPDFTAVNWNTAVSPAPIYVEVGQVNSGHQLSLWANSFISGYVTSNGVDGIPGVPVQALGQWSNGNSAITDNAGYYVIPGLRVAPNPYDVFPVLLPDQTASPVNINLNVTKGQYNTGNDFILTNARVSISGQVLLSSSPIESGVSIYASTSSVSASSPPDITYSLRLSGQRDYQAVSDGQGNYTLSVIAGETYNLVAWYTDSNGTTSKTQTVVLPVNSGQSGVNFTWP